MHRIFTLVLLVAAASTAVVAVTQKDVADAIALFRKAAGPTTSNQFLKFAGRMVQLWFHDGTTFSVAKDGGPNGCVHRRSGANKGVLGQLQTVDNINAQLKNRISKADLIVLGASVVIMDSIPANTPKNMDLLADFRGGRKDSSQCNSEDSALQNPTGGISTVRNEVSARLSLTKGETVALMGAHTLGGAHQSISGFSGPFDPTPAAFDNSYFTSMLEKEWFKQTGAAGVFWKSKDGMLRFNVDMALMVDTGNCKTSTKGCPVQPQGTNDWVKVFAQDVNQWHANFASAFQKVSSNGLPGLTPLSQMPK